MLASPFAPATSRHLEVIILGSGTAVPEADRFPSGVLVVADDQVILVDLGPGVLRRMAQAGHRVTLIERGDRLGGTLQFASIAYQPNEKLLHWLRLQIERSSVEVRLNCEATVELLRESQRVGHVELGSEDQSGRYVAVEVVDRAPHELDRGAGCNVESVAETLVHADQSNGFAHEIPPPRSDACWGISPSIGRSPAEVSAERRAPAPKGGRSCNPELIWWDDQR